MTTCILSLSRSQSTKLGSQSDLLLDLSVEFESVIFPLYTWKIVCECESYVKNTQFLYLTIIDIVPEMKRKKYVALNKPRQSCYF